VCTQCKNGYYLSHGFCTDDEAFTFSAAGEDEDEEGMTAAERKSMAVALLSAFCILLFCSKIALIIACCQRGFRPTVQSFEDETDEAPVQRRNRILARLGHGPDRSIPLATLAESRPVVVRNPGNDIAVGIKEAF